MIKLTHLSVQPTINLGGCVHLDNTTTLQRWEMQRAARLLGLSVLNAILASVLSHYLPLTTSYTYRPFSYIQTGSYIQQAHINLEYSRHRVWESSIWYILSPVLSYSLFPCLKPCPGFCFQPPFSGRLLLSSLLPLAFFTNNPSDINQGFASSGKPFLINLAGSDSPCRFCNYLSWDSLIHISAAGD